MKLNKRFVVHIAVCLMFVFAITMPLSAPTISLARSHKLLEPGDVEKITFSSRAYWSEGRNYYTSSLVTVYPDKITAEMLYEGWGSAEDQKDVPDNTLAEYPISTEIYQKMIDDMNSQYFLDIPDDLSDYTVCDGSELIIEVLTPTAAYRKGGANPSDNKFLSCFELPFNTITKHASTAMQYKMEHENGQVSFYVLYEDNMYRLYVTPASGKSLVLDCFQSSAVSPLGGMRLTCGDSNGYISLDWSDDYRHASIYASLQLPDEWNGNYNAVSRLQ